MLLHDHGINEETLLARFDAQATERSGLVASAEARASAFAASTGTEAIFCLHLLAALTELPDGIAYRMLVRVGIWSVNCESQPLTMLSRVPLNTGTRRNAKNQFLGKLLPLLQWMPSPDRTLKPNRATRVGRSDGSITGCRPKSISARRANGASIGHSKQCE